MSGQRIQLVPELTAIAQTYRNKSCIADMIMPKVKVDTPAFQYMSYNKESYLSVPDTRIGEKGIPNTIELKGTLLTANVETHALQEVVPVATKEAHKAGNGEDLGIKATNQLTDVLKLRKEIEAAKFLGDTKNYGSNLKTLETVEKIDKADSNAVSIIQTAIDNMFYAANTMVLSRKAASALRQNPYIVDACGMAAKKAGIVPFEALKELFGLDKILVGEGVHNVAKKGTNLQLQNCWADNIVLLHLNDTISTDYGFSFGYEAEYEALTIGKYFDEEPGTKGADVYKAFYSNKFLAIAPELGYLIKDVLTTK
ncbi:hypothetical protein IJE86_11525 [bacterium]|nr:hypothetical protein [bacterium]